MQLLVLTIGMLLSGCAASPPVISTGKTARPSQDAAPGAVAPVPVEDVQGFGYELLRREDTQLVEVFDDTHRTYLVFERQVPAGLLLFDERGQAMPFAVTGRTAVADGVKLGLLVRTPTHSSYAQAPKAAVVARLGMPGASDAASSRRLPVDMAAARAEILRVEGRLGGLRAELDQAARGEPSTPLSALRTEIEEIQTILDGVDATLVRAHFAVGSALLLLSTGAKQAILEAAHRADEIQIRGGADQSGSAAANDVLARRRAWSMRRVLIEGGIAADKVRVDSAAAVYIASNATPDGRAVNRRVDVLFTQKPEGIDQVAQDTQKTQASSPADRSSR